MRILHITGSYAPTINGVAVSVEGISKQMRKQGNQVFVLAPTIKGGLEDDFVLRYASIENPALNGYPIPLAPGPKTLKRLFALGHFDIVHVHHPFHIGLFARMIARQFGAPLVFSFHTDYDAYAEKYVSFLPKPFREEFLTNQVYDFCKKVDLVVANSRFMKKRIQKRVGFQKIIVIPTGVSFRNSPPKIHSVDDERVKLLYVGRVAKEKNIMLLPKVMQKLPQNFHLGLVGDGPELEKFRAEVLRLRLTRRVKFYGFVKHANLPEIFLSSDIFIFPSKTETQGLIFLEAQYFGLPVVAVKSAAAEEWVKAGLVTKNGAGDFSKKVVLQSQGLSEELSNKAKVFASNYKIEETVEKLLASYNKLLHDT